MSLYSDTIIGDGAVAYWPLNETSGTIAVDIIGGNNGVISGGVTLGQSGALSNGDKAMGFDGSTAKVTVTPASVAALSVLSVEVWAYVTAVSNNGVLAKLQGAGVNSGWSILAETNKWNWRIGSADVLGPSVVQNQWTHLVGTSDGTTRRFYVNGIETTPVAGAGPGTGAGDLIIGSLTAGAIYPFNGRIDDVAIYPTTLTSAQVANHYNVARSAEPISPALLGIGVRELLLPNYKYIVPIKTRLINWQSPTGSSLTTSMDGTNFAALGTSGANEVKQVTSFGSFIRTNSFDTIVVAK